MNKNSIIGIILILGIIITWSVMNTPSREQIQKQKQRADSIAAAKKAADSIVEAEEVFVAAEEAKQETGEKPVVTQAEVDYGVFTPLATGEEKLWTIENDVLKLTLTSKGAYVKTVQLKNYETYDKNPLIGFDENTSLFNVGLNIKGNKNNLVNTADLFFTPYLNGEPYTGDTAMVVSDVDLTFSFRANTFDNSGAMNPDQYVEFVYKVNKDDYMVDFNVKTINMKNVIATNANYLNLMWTVDLLQQEKAVDRYNGTNIYYRMMNEDVESLTGDRSGNKDETKTIENSIQWFSFKQRFFSYALVSDASFRATLSMQTRPHTHTRYLKSMYADVQVPFDGYKADNDIAMHYYFGPNSLKVLDKYNIDLDKQIPLGGKLVGWINRYIVVNVFSWLESYGWNYGIVILVLTIIIKLVLMPFAYKSYQSSAKMRILKPEIEEINERYPKQEDAMKKQQAIMELYKKAGASPTSGCLPMLLQLPVLWAIFRFFPASIELRQKSFLWADDLSTYDSILDLGFNIPFYGDHVSLFTLLMTITTLLYTYINNKQMAATNAQGMKGMKVIMYIMPIMFLGIFNDYSSGLSYYYMLVNIITFIQMYLFRVFTNEDKLRKKIELAKQRPVKKSRFQKRLEELQKQQQQMQRRK